MFAKTSSRICWTILLSACVLSACVAKERVIEAPKVEVSKEDAAVLPWLPKDAQRTELGFAYVILDAGSEVYPPAGRAVDVKISAFDVSGTLLESQEATLAPWRKTSAFEEVAGHLAVGARARLWGESQEHIWELELVGVSERFSPPLDIDAAPEDAASLSLGGHWRFVSKGEGVLPKANQFVRIHATRWKASGEIVESNRDSDGMIVLLNAAQAENDPLHRELLMLMPVGSHVRAWIPAESYGGSVDLVEDLWLEEILFKFDPPEALLSGPDEAESEALTEGVWLHAVDAKDEAGQLAVDGEAVLVDMRCWSKEDGRLVESSDLRGGRQRLELGPELGPWHSVLSHAEFGKTYYAWFSASSLPADAALAIACVFSIAKEESLPEL